MLPTQELLLQLLTYSPSTGKLLWNERPIEMFKTSRACTIWNKKYSGKEAGTISNVKNSDLQYIHISINNKIYRAHMLIWIMIHGNIEGIIDHIDGNGLNNILINLRDISQSKNIRKCKMRKNNSSGHRGVTLTESGRYAVCIMIDRKKIHLGRYDDIQYASMIYSTAALIISGETFSESPAFEEDTTEYKFIENKINSKRFNHD